MRYFSLTLLSLIVLASCTVHRTTYVYFHLKQPNIEPSGLGQPPVEAYRGDSIPVGWDLDTNAGKIHIQIGKNSFIPNVVVSSESDIVVSASPSCAFIHEDSAREWIVDWGFWRTGNDGCVNVGDDLHLTIEIEGRMEKINVVGEVRQAGTFRYVDSL